MISADTPDETTRVYDRAFLLSPAKRNQVMALWEVQRYGLDSFGDADYTRLYGMPPAEWYQRGIRLLARTTVECVRDALGDAIGQDVKRILHHAPSVAGITVIDPFAGSCNSLYWILRHLPAARGIAFELDPTIFALTQANIAALDRPIEVLHGDFRSLLPAYPVPADHLVIVFVAPPWGDALNAITGLDLRRTQPPITNVVDDIDSIYKDKPTLYVIDGLKTPAFGHGDESPLALRVAHVLGSYRFSA